MTSVAIAGIDDACRTSVSLLCTWTCEQDHRVPATEDDERTADDIRRALRLLDREAWLTRARADADHLADEDLSDEADAR